MTTGKTFPPSSELKIGFAHHAYQLKERFAARDTGIDHFQVYTRDELAARMPEMDVLVVSGLWHDALLDNAPNLRWVQSVGTGFDQFPLDRLRERGIHLTRAFGVMREAVAEQAIACMLSLARHLHFMRDYQRHHAWRSYISDIGNREAELAGKTCGIVGLGLIGSRVAELAKAFNMRVIATKGDPSTYDGPADQVTGADGLDDLLRESDYVVLTCPLTDQTRGLINERTLGLMKRSAFLVNVARGGCVVDEDLVPALRSCEIAGAALDHFHEEPLGPDSPYWELDNVIVTPHNASETRMYEENLMDILVENLGRLGRGQTELLHQVV
ncbi:MAG: D-2-hydroxyacid dehydrogenase [Chloroflexi bacterium]|nr:D-2-hydroxyacid dehydrogenase [Chloroflexota bacterium]